MMSETANLIKCYFMKGLHYEEILLFLKLKHDIELSLSTLKRRLRCMGLYRKKYFSNDDTIERFIKNELNFSGQLVGYRWMHHRCVQHGLVVTQQKVRSILQTLDEDGVRLRKRKRLKRRKYTTKGPNYVWHMDAYDKLKPFGLCISGAIDGFSRHIMWLKVGRTSSDPKIIGGYFIEAIEQFGGCPRIVRADFGTENVVVEKCQRILREHPLDCNDLAFGTKSFIYGTSQCNQRIESWWSTLRKHSSQFWMNLLDSIKENGNFTGLYSEKCLIQFCFSDILQKDLDLVVDEWNTHVISASRNAVAPRGRPIILFDLPQLYDTENYICKMDHSASAAMYACKDVCDFYKLPCDTDIFALSKLIMHENNYLPPSDAYDAVELYTNIRQHLQKDFSLH